MPSRGCDTPGCPNPHRARGLCSTHYNQQHGERHRKVLAPCTTCGKPVARAVKNDRRHVCSLACRKTLVGHTGTTRWEEWAGDRARKQGATIIDDFTDTDVFERDAWTCYLCHQPVDTTVDKLHRLAPTVDHVVPPTRGGQHTLDNVRCAHLACNSAKSDRI